MKNMKILGGLLAGSSLILSACTAIPPEGRVILVGSSPGWFHDLGYGMATGIDAGRVSGMRFADGDYAYTWRLGTGITDLSGSPPTNMADAYDVRGLRAIGSASNRAVVWNEGAITVMGMSPSGNTCGARALSDSRIVGWMIDSTYRMVPVQWTTQGTMSELPFSTGNEGMALATRGSVTVGGAWALGSFRPSVFLSPDMEYPDSARALAWIGTANPIALPGLSANGFSIAYGVEGQAAVGCSIQPTAPRQTVAVKWDSTGTPQVLGSLGGRRACATAITKGIVVGGAQTAAGDMHAFSWTSGGTIQDIHPSGWRWSIALDVDENGSIVGYGQAQDGYTHGFAYLKVPDLQIESVSTTTVLPKAHERLSIDVRVKNIGSAPALFPSDSSSRVSVRRQDGVAMSYSPSTSAEVDIAPGGTAVFTVSLPPYSLPGGPSELVFKVDPSNTIAERNEDNNDFQARITMDTQVDYPDLRITSVTTSIASPTWPDEFDFNITVRNGGTLPASITYPSLVVDGGAHSNYVYPPYQSTWTLAAGAAQTFSAKATMLAMQPGTKTAVFTVDPFHRVTESDETNNSFSLSFTVAPQVIVPGQQPDLVIDSYSLRSAQPKVHERLFMDVVVSNVGTTTATMPSGLRKLSIRKDDGTSISAGWGASTLTIAPGATGTTYLNFEPYSLAPGTLRFILKVDPDGQVAELSKTNNELSGQMTVAPQVEFADLTITNLVAVPQNPVYPQEFDFSVTVRNNGTVDAVIQYPDLVLDGGAHTNYVYPPGLGTWRLGPGASQTFTTKATTTARQPGTKTVTMRADPFNRVVESHETNNTASVTVTVSE
jgi:probable HAF family extracellular repeat protein